MYCYEGLKHFIAHGFGDYNQVLSCQKQDYEETQQVPTTSSSSPDAAGDVEVVPTRI